MKLLAADLYLHWFLAQAMVVEERATWQLMKAYFSEPRFRQHLFGFLSTPHCAKSFAIFEVQRDWHTMKETDRVEKRRSCEIFIFGDICVRIDVDHGKDSSRLQDTVDLLQCLVWVCLIVNAVKRSDIVEAIGPLIRQIHRIFLQIPQIGQVLFMGPFISVFDCRLNEINANKFGIRIGASHEHRRSAMTTSHVKVVNSNT